MVSLSQPSVGELRHCESPESGLIPHTDLEPDGVTASAAWQSMGSGVLDCRTAFAMTTGSWKAKRCTRTPRLGAKRRNPNRTPSLRVSSSGSEPHTDLEPGGVTASAAWQSMGSEVLDCFTAFAMTTGSWKAKRGNPRWRAADMDCRASLAMTEDYPRDDGICRDQIRDSPPTELSRTTHHDPAPFQTN